MSKHLVMLTAATPCDCELPDGSERSVDGCLRLLPNFPVEVTSDELAALKAIDASIVVLSQGVPPAPASAPARSSAPFKNKKKKASAKAKP